MIGRRAVAISGFRSETVAVKGVRLHYWIGGSPEGQPVILWHGFLSTGYAWRAVALRLAEAGLAVLVPDMRGYGDSDKPEGKEGYDARALAEECRALAGQIGFGGGQPVVLAGHDMGALPALIWAADHPDEVAGLLYIEAPVMLSEVLQGIIRYERTAMEEGSMWWWILPLAPGVPDLLAVGHEREFLTWFYDRYTAKREAIEPETVDEYLRTFSSRKGVLGAMGIYRAAFTSIDQTEPLQKRKVTVPVVALGGLKSLGPMVGQMVEKVAEHVEAHTLADGGHFLPEECPNQVARHVLALSRRSAGERRPMTNGDHAPAQPGSAIPPDDPGRKLVLARPDGPGHRHVGIAGNTYTILLTGQDTAGRYSLIDMHVPSGEGPSSHRHDYEEMLTVLEGEIELTFRGERLVARAGDALNIPANAPHSFTNASKAPARLLCMCTPAGQDELFTMIGVTVEGRTTPAPEPSREERQARMEMSKTLAARYRTEFLA